MATNPTPLMELLPGPGKLSSTLINLIIRYINVLTGGIAQTARAVSSGADFQAPTTPGAITGASLTMQVTGNNAVAIVWGTACIGVTAVDAGKIMAASLQVDGVAQSGEAIGGCNVVANFQTHGQTWVVPVGNGARTFALFGRTDGASLASKVFRSGHCTLSVLLLDLP